MARTPFRVEVLTPEGAFLLKGSIDDVLEAAKKGS